MPESFSGYLHYVGDRKYWSCAECEWQSQPVPTGAELDVKHDHLSAADPVNSPDHYRWLPVEAIEITEHFNFCMGNALKYLLRADHKGNPIDDLRKSIWYIQREIANREKELDSSD